jgi:NADH-quinone oxidoreductase subunit J
MTVELVIFLLLALVALVSAAMMLLSRNAVHSALWLVLNFAVVALFFLWLGAPFIAMVQVTVYAGAIMVLFLFVIMLLGAEMVQGERNVLRSQPLLTLFFALIFLGVAGLYFLSGGAGAAPEPFAGAEAARAFGGPTEVGLALFTQYSLPFEITSLLLLVGMIGAVALTRDERKQ